MNRKDICKNIIQSIYEYITSPDKLEPHREKNHFVRKRKLSEYSCAMKSHFRKFGNQMSGSGNHLYNYASLLA